MPSLWGNKFFLLEKQIFFEKNEISEIEFMKSDSSLRKYREQIVNICLRFFSIECSMYNIPYIGKLGYPRSPITVLWKD